MGEMLDKVKNHLLEIENILRVNSDNATAGDGMKRAIEKWYVINEIINSVDRFTDGDFCPLCEVYIGFPRLGCEKCPIGKDYPSCDGTPYSNVLDAIWVLEHRIYEEIEFLEVIEAKNGKKSRRGNKKGD